MTSPTQNNTTSVSATGFRWSSPMPYLFGGFALMLTLTACALIILICSYNKQAYYSFTSNLSENSARDDEDKSSVPEFQMELRPEMEQKIVIVMPGEDNPIYLAKPAPP